MSKKTLFVLAAAAGALAWWLFKGGQPVKVPIPERSSAADVARTLKESGVLSQTRTFRLLLKLTRLDRKLKPGVYDLRAGMSAPYVIWTLYRGGEGWIKVTIPEGWRLDQTADRVGASGVSDGRAFLDYARSQNWEGYLFPTTYFFTKNMPADEVARDMRAEFDRQVLPVYKASGRSLDLDKVVTLASIIERETTLDSERPLIASVYYNRFARNMRLEADPTVQYALGYWKKGLTLQDLQVASPYNTYLHGGMPPGPICSPGLASIRAALAPAQTPYLYFMADYKGGHTFQTNYADFLKAKVAAKRVLRRQKADLRREREDE